MPTINENRYAKPSTLAEVLRQVRDAFDAMGDPTPIMVGKSYLSQGVGSAPRVLFVPDARGKVESMIEMGNAAGVVRGCDVLIRASESGDDFGRYDAAETLADRVIDCIETAVPGRVTFGDLQVVSPTDADAFGAEFAFGFTYKRDVRHDAARWALPPGTLDTTAPQPGIPPGKAGTVGSITPTTVPKEG